MRRAVAVLFGLAGCASMEDYRGPVPGAHESEAFAAIVVDATDGSPLAGVRVALYRDDTEPEGIPGALVHEARTDRSGVVSFPWREEYAGCHFVFDAIGYAPHCQFPPIEDRIALRPGRTWHGQLLDATGAPAAGVRVEFYSGCPHAPALRTTTTADDGSFALWCVGTAEDGSPDGYVWAPAPGSATYAVSPRAMPVPGGVLEPLMPDPGVTVTGTVFDASGKPAKGAVVYSTQFDRGPKVRTADDGTFTLVGVEPDADVLFGQPGASANMTRTEPPEPAAPESSGTSNVRVRAPYPGFLYFGIGEDGSVDPDEDGNVVLRTRLRGPVYVDYAHEESGDGRLVVDVNAVDVDVPPTAFRVPAMLTVPEGVDVAVLDAQGGWGAEGRSSWHYVPGARVRLTRDGCATNYRSLHGSGPYDLRPGDATLDIRTGDVKDAVCWIDGERFEPGPVRGLDAGAHTILVGAPDRIGRAGIVTLSGGETKTIDLKLSKR